MTYDIFITHAWRYHDDWNRLVMALDNAAPFKWRNFSLPWYDPAFSLNSAVGRDIISRSLEGQISPAHCCIVLQSVYDTASAQKWVTTELELARKFNKPVIALPTWGTDKVSPEVRALCDSVSSWALDDIIASVRRAISAEAA